ncbi:trypsin-like peptidase domain-containing protein [Candidatus Synechococcus calcipolaris G9]|uniref:Trypsin-like peptidase domain-containing protein n=1 Tax=Candidatus Synechococcus calcipolaris G9 TaxID=1497997 RepID=A0ABT6EXS4_9SYNE|nr:serine protease [Candidatus Synechococcus calcipolaris]MDG2990615.1 trypsin-like peptidase domain-containing protein [Candidatus Synechococcus calcipolaris G9]
MAPRFWQSIYSLPLLCSIILGGSTVILREPIPVQAASVTEIARTAKTITVLIEGGSGHGSGILLQRNSTTYTILTARHVVEKPGQYHVSTADGQRYSLITASIKPLPGVDLATVEFQSNRDYPLAQLGNSNDVVEGMPVYVAGFPAQGSSVLGGIYQFTEGRLTANASRPIEDGYALVYTNATLPGMSGGPVLDEKGQLVGVHGSADVASTLMQEGSSSSNVFVKRGFNLGIPINTYLSLAPQDPGLPVVHQLRIDPADAPITLKPADYFLEAEGKFQKQDYAGAISAYGKAIELNPNYSEAYLGRAVAQLFQLVPDENFSALGEELGVKHLHRLTQGNPLLKDAFPANPPSPLLNHFLTAFRANPGTLQSDLAQAIALNPSYAEAYGVSSFFNLILGNFGSAVSDIDSGLALDPNNMDLHVIRGLALFLGGEFRQSLSAFDRLSQDDPNNTDYHLLRGLAAFLIADYDASRSSWGELIRINPQEALPYSVRAITYILEENFNAAIPDLQTAAQIFRSEGDIASYQDIADILRELGVNTP